jgi:hypothetical protein
MDDERMKILEKPTMSVDDLALVLDVCPVSARRAVRRGEFESFKVGKLDRVKTAPVRKLLGVA